MAHSWPMGKIIKRWSLALILGFVVFVGYQVHQVGELNEAGYCFEEKRFLAEEEFIKDAMLNTHAWVAYHSIEDFEQDRDKGRGVTFDRKRITNPFIYRDYAHFEEVNPDCCRFFDEPYDGYYPDKHIRRGGSFAGFVTVKFRVQKEAPGQSEIQRTVLYEYTNCGEAW